MVETIPGTRLVPAALAAIVLGAGSIETPAAEPAPPFCRTVPATRGRTFLTLRTSSSSTPAGIRRIPISHRGCHHRAGARHGDLFPNLFLARHAPYYRFDSARNQNPQLRRYDRRRGARTPTFVRLDPRAHRDRGRAGMMDYPLTPTLESTPAWDDLVRGHGRRAVLELGRLSRTRPLDGSLKAAYALAAALTGDHPRAARAMRRGFHIDPFGARQVPVEPRIRDRVLALVPVYDQRIDRRIDSVDDLFMHAALSFFLGDHQRARRSALLASAWDDNRDQAITNLLDLIEEDPLPVATEPSATVGE